MTTLFGATLRFEDLGLFGGSANFTLDASGWTGLGSPAGAAGYKYKGKNDALDPNPKGTCRVVLLTADTIKAVCKDDGLGGVPLTTPFAGSSSVQLKLPDSTYCAEFAVLDKERCQRPQREERTAAGRVPDSGGAV
jgi:hypothetical protein